MQLTVTKESGLPWVHGINKERNGSLMPKEKYEAIVQGLMDGKTRKEIAAECQTDPKRVSIIAEKLEDEGILESPAKALSRKIGRVLNYSVEQLLSDWESGKKKGFNCFEYGILFDKKQVLDGQATQRIEYVGPGLEQLKQDLKNIVDVQEVTPPPQVTDGPATDNH